MGRHMPRGTRKKLIVAAVNRLTSTEAYDSVSMRDVAYEIGMKPSSHLMGMLYELVKEQVLHCRWVQHRKNVQAARFTLSRQWIDSREAMQAYLANDEAWRKHHKAHWSE